MILILNFVNTRYETKIKQQNLEILYFVLCLPQELTLGFIRTLEDKPEMIYEEE